MKFPGYHCVFFFLIFCIVLVSAVSSDLPNEADTITASKIKDGTIYEYARKSNGQEVMKVIGTLPSDFDQTKVLEEFRETLGISAKSSDSLHPKAQPSVAGNLNANTFTTEEEHPKEDEKLPSLLETFSQYLITKTNWGYKVQFFFEEATKNQIDEQVQIAEEDFRQVEDDLSKLLVQELILRNRQAELGAYLEETFKKEPHERNPTVMELVTLEDDRLSLLEHRLSRIKTKLKQQKKELEDFLKQNRKKNSLTSPERTETHICVSQLDENVEKNIKN